jgi:hypothetical protein
LKRDISKAITIVGYIVMIIYLMTYLFFGRFLFKTVFVVFCIVRFLLDLTNNIYKITKSKSRNGEFFDSIRQIITAIIFAPLFLVNFTFYITTNPKISSMLNVICLLIIFTSTSLISIIRKNDQK